MVCERVVQRERGQGIARRLYIIYFVLKPIYLHSRLVARRDRRETSHPRLHAARLGLTCSAALAGAGAAPGGVWILALGIHNTLHVCGDFHNTIRGEAADVACVFAVVGTVYQLLLREAATLGVRLNKGGRR